MSIKSLFEDVADAIRVTSGSDDTYTPAEMPQAIRNLSSIFQTKTLSSPIGGQTTVEGCLSSLSSDLSEKQDDHNKIIASVTADGSKTVAQLVKTLIESVDKDMSKVNFLSFPSSGEMYALQNANSYWIVFSVTYVTTTNRTDSCIIYDNGSVTWCRQSGSNAIENLSSNVLTSGQVIQLLS